MVNKKITNNEKIQTALHTGQCSTDFSKEKQVASVLYLIFIT